MELKNKSVKSKDKVKTEGPKPVHSRKAPLVAGLAVSALLAFGGCTAKEQDTESETMERNPKCLVYGRPVVETKTVSYTKTVKEGDIACQGAESPIASGLKVVKIDERGVHFAYEADIARGRDERIDMWYGASFGFSGDFAPKIKVEKGKTPGEAVITVEYSEQYKEWLNDDLVENYEAKTISYTKVVEENGSIPLAAWTGSDSKVANADLRLMDANEEGIKINMGSYGMFVGNPPLEIMKIPYGETLRLETKDAVFEITPECVEVIGEASPKTVVTVKTTLL